MKEKYKFCLLKDFEKDNKLFCNNLPLILNYNKENNIIKNFDNLKIKDDNLSLLEDIVFYETNDNNIYYKTKYFNFLFLVDEEKFYDLFDKAKYDIKKIILLDLINNEYNYLFLEKEEDNNKIHIKTYENNIFKTFDKDNILNIDLRNDFIEKHIINNNDLDIINNLNIKFYQRLINYIAITSNYLSELEQEKLNLLFIISYAKKNKESNIEETTLLYHFINKISENLNISTVKDIINALKINDNYLFYFSYWEQNIKYLALTDKFFKQINLLKNNNFLVSTKINRSNNIELNLFLLLFYKLTKQEDFKLLQNLLDYMLTIQNNPKFNKFNYTVLNDFLERNTNFIIENKELINIKNLLNILEKNNENIHLLSKLENLLVKQELNNNTQEKYKKINKI